MDFSSFHEVNDKDVAVDSAGDDEAMVNNVKIEAQVIDFQFERKFEGRASSSLWC
jgi:hypothetical protein